MSRKRLGKLAGEKTGRVTAKAECRKRERVYKLHIGKIVSVKRTGRGKRTG